MTRLGPEYLRKSGRVRLSKGQTSAKRLGVFVSRTRQKKTKPTKPLLRAQGKKQGESGSLLDKTDAWDKRIKISNNRGDYCS